MATFSNYCTPLTFLVEEPMSLIRNDVKKIKMAALVVGL